MSIDINSQGDVNVGGDVVGRDKITHVTNYYRAPSWAEAKHQRNRATMIQNVRNFWVKGVLENSLYGAVLLQLGLEYKPEAVEQPWNVILRRAERPDQPLTAGARNIEVFDEAGGALLILGAPGSGKTTTLLELARDLLTRAEEDGTAPIPVVFPLSSWAEQRSPLADWLVEELFRRYDVPRKVGATWIKQEMVLPLLDGLDEVQAEHRDDCARVINAFRAEHGLVPLVVCSRITDYEALSTRLHLRAAVVLQPLTAEQVDAHLVKLGPGTATVQSLLAVDENLLELAATPLMLGIMLVAYQDANTANVAALETLEARRAKLFERYIQRMLERPAELRVYTSVQSQLDQGDNRTKISYSTHETMHWLAWLARSMKMRNQGVFYLEWMQPDWLPKGELIIGLFGSLLTGLVFGLLNGLLTGLLYGLVGGLVFGLAGGLVGGLAGGLVGGLVGSRHIRSVEVIHWSWSRARSRLVFGLVYGLVLWLVGGLVFGLLNGLVLGLVFALFGGLFGGLVFGLFGGLVVGLFGGLIVDEITTRESPNEGMRRSARNALVFGLFGGLVFGLFSGLFGRLFFGLNGGLGAGLFFGLNGGLVVGLGVGLFYGGLAYLQHLILRVLLWRSGSTPYAREYVRFLDHAAERVLLRKVGGGYIFIHRLLLEYFAELGL